MTPYPGMLAVFAFKNKQVVQIQIQVAHVEAVSTRVEFAGRGQGGQHLTLHGVRWLAKLEQIKEECKVAIEDQRPSQCGEIMCYKYRN